MSCTISVVTKKEDIPLKPVDGKPTYVYWKILGLAQSARLALVAAQVDFVDVQIDAYDADYGKDGWIAAKATPEMQTLLTFPNLPYFLHPDFGQEGLVQVSIVGLVPYHTYSEKGLLKSHSCFDRRCNLACCQSDSILRFIGTKYDMLGASPAKTDMYLEHLHDAETMIARLSYGQGADKLLAWYKGSIPGYLAPFAKLVGDNKYLSGNDNSPSVADFKLYVLLYKLTVIQDQLGDETTKTILGADNPWEKEYMGRIEAIPSIKAFMASSQYMKGPMNNPVAKWHG